MHAFKTACATATLLALTGCAGMDPQAMQAAAGMAGQLIQHRMEVSQQRRDWQAQQDAHQQALAQRQAAMEQQAREQQAWRQRAMEQRFQQQRAQVRLNPYQPVPPGSHAHQHRYPGIGWGAPSSR
jgi:hypothetical protein